MYYPSVRRLAVGIASVAIASACGGRTTTAPSAAAVTPPGATIASDYLAQVISLMENNSINRNKINWTDFKAQVSQRAQGAQTIEATYPAISLALGLLDDHHSFFLTPSGQGVANPSGRRCSAPAVSRPDLPNDIGYVRITAFADPTQAAINAFADGIQRQIRDADRAELAGWIVDVRGNGGGNMWPMVAGVGPVLGDGIIGYFIPPIGPSTPWVMQDGRATFNGNTLAQTSVVYRVLRGSPRVAVLTDGGVASSGEAVVGAFHGRPNARSFGGATCGLSTANTGFTLTDGATLVLTVSTMADRNQRVFGDVIVPDETITGDAAVVERAVAWLRST